ncbi:hypothetical protein HY095_04575 [Candidatus Micrarchaeota archaeon]|nr:hypothetical protein [Candidatus Micrarchaeota archaeon]
MNTAEAFAAIAGSKPSKPCANTTKPILNFRPPAATAPANEVKSSEERHNDCASSITATNSRPTPSRWQYAYNFRKNTSTKIT